MAGKMLSLEIPDDLREALRVRAFEEKVSISKLIRSILAEEVLKKESQINVSKLEGQKVTSNCRISK